MLSDKFIKQARKPKSKDITGQRFGKLIAIKKVGTDNRRNAIWLCKCDCGNDCQRIVAELTKNKNHSCGCLANEHLKNMAKNNTTHGMTKTGIYRSYKAMMSRCYREKDIHFNAYGKRGISVCDEWKGHPKTFIEWGLQHGWEEHLTLERINVNGNYEPSNCKWIPMSEQYKNKQSNAFTRTIQGRRERIRNESLEV